jgi:hypothetical protein
MSDYFFLKNFDRVLRNAGLGDGEYPLCMLVILQLKSIICNQLNKYKPLSIQHLDTLELSNIGR